MLLRLLVKHDAYAYQQFGVAAAKLAKQPGLDSILTLLEENRVHIKGVDWETPAKRPYSMVRRKACHFGLPRFERISVRTNNPNLALLLEYTNKV